MSEIIEKKFYVLRTVTGKEDKVREYIEGEIAQGGFSGLVYQVLVPKEKVSIQRANKRMTVERPLYSGYIFVEAILTGEVPHQLRSVSDVLGFLKESKAGEPAPMRPIDVRDLLKRMDESLETEQDLEMDFEIGEIVKVLDGAFSGCDAVVETIDSDLRKVNVMVKMFGRKVPLELGYAQIARV